MRAPAQSTSSVSPGLRRTRTTTDDDSHQSSQCRQNVVKEQGFRPEAAQESRYSP